MALDTFELVFCPSIGFKLTSENCDAVSKTKLYKRAHEPSGGDFVAPIPLQGSSLPLCFAFMLLNSVFSYYVIVSHHLCIVIACIFTDSSFHRLQIIFPR